MSKARAAASEATARAVLQKHGCPVPFHEVRARFLDGIATPTLSASPMRVLEGVLTAKPTGH